MGIEVVEIVTAGPQGIAGLPSEFSYAAVADITIVDDTYEELINLSTDTSAGVYKVDKSLLYSLDSVVNSAYFRFSIDGGNTWVEIRKEPKDNTDLIPIAHFNTVTHPGGVLNIVIQARKGNTSDVMVVQQANVSLERKQ